MTKRYKLYWIYDDRQAADPVKDGYVGITTESIEKRLDKHKNTEFNAGSVSTYPRKMYSILKDIPEEHIKIKEICWSTCEDMICKVEQAFRPTANIGWNTHKGGKRIGKTRPFTITTPDGTRKEYRTFVQAREDGYNDGHIHEVLSSNYNRKSFRGGCIAEYI